jgi:hypothetical protein
MKKKTADNVFIFLLFKKQNSVLITLIQIKNIFFKFTSSQIMKRGTRVLKRRTFHPHFCQTAKKNLQNIFSSKVGAFALRSSLSIIGHARPYH